MSARTFSHDRPGAARPSASPAPSADGPPSGRVPLRLAPRGGGSAATPSWREREAAREAAGERPTSSGRGSLPPPVDGRAAGVSPAPEHGMYRGGSGRGRPEAPLPERERPGMRDRQPRSERDDESPAPSAAGGASERTYKPGMFRSSQQQQPRSERDEESPAPGGAPAEGKYRPGMFSAMRKK
jgi:hypothetical protein